MSSITVQEYLSTVKIGPAQYHNKKGIIRDTGSFCKSLSACRVIISGGVRARNSVTPILFDSLDKYGIAYTVNEFVGETSIKNIDDLKQRIVDFGADIVIGLGGGKSLDTAKIVADMCNLPIITIPTIIGTCSCTSPLCIIYSDEGVYQKDYYPQNNPNIVLVDPEVLINSPIEYFKSGLLDSLSKWYEGHSSYRGSDTADMFDTMAIVLSDYLNHEINLKAGFAIESFKNKEITSNLTDMINQVLYVAGTIQALGVKAVRNGIAHATHNGLTVLKESHHLAHGEKVGYGLAILILLMDGKTEKLQHFLNFCHQIEFAPSLSSFSIPFTEANISAIAEKIVSDPLMKRKPFDILTSENFKEAIREIEKIIETK